jgi:hypothetical protein
MPVIWKRISFGREANAVTRESDTKLDVGPNDLKTLLADVQERGMNNPGPAFPTTAVVGLRVPRTFLRD